MAGRPSKRQQQYFDEVAGIYASYADEMTVFGERVIDLLEDIQMQLRIKILSISDTDWLALNLTNISEQIDVAMVAFVNQYNQLMAESLDVSGNAGVNVLVTPLRNTLDVSLMAFEPSIFAPIIFDPAFNAQLAISSTLITNASQQAARNILDKIIVGMVSGDTKQSVVDNIVGELGGERLGFKSLNDRAWAIFRTENGRMNSVATELQMKSALETIPKARKIWFHSAQFGAGQHPRKGHVQLDGKTVPVNEQFQNPVTGELLWYPHDVLAPASEVINCGCAHTLDMPDDAYLRDRTLVNV